MTASRELIFKKAGASPITVTASGTSDVIDNLQQFHSFVVEYNLTAAATDAGDALALYLQTSFDGGVTWRDLCRFLDRAGNAAVPVASQYGLSDWGDSDSGLFAATDAGLAANTSADLSMGDRLRLKWVVTDADADASWTFTCQGIARG